MKRIFDYAILILLIITLASFAGCGGEKETPQTTTETTAEVAEGTTPVPEPVTMQDTIAYNLNIAMARLRLGDKSGLYENEFEYMREQTTFDDYLKLRQIEFAQADTVDYLEIVDLLPYGHDSADISVVVHFKGPTGLESEWDDRITVYYHEGRWIKPTASNIAEQVKFEESGGK